MPCTHTCPMCGGVCSTGCLFVVVTARVVAAVDGAVVIIIIIIISISIIIIIIIIIITNCYFCDSPFLAQCKFHRCAFGIRVVIL